MPQSVSPSSSVSAPVPGSVTAAASSTAEPRPTSATALLTRRRLGATDSSSSPRETSTREEAQTERQPDDDDFEAEMSWTAKNQWMVYAIASGACAAFNGVFAKLTTNDLTSHIARGISSALGLEGMGNVLEIAVRVMFFGLNLAFNGVMWTLFTQALAKGDSTTQVAIMNTSTNFFFTALMGFAIFAESLPPLWWAGATLLVAGNVIIGRKNGDDEADADAAAGDEDDEEAAEAAEQGLGGIPPGSEYKDDPAEDQALLLLDDDDDDVPQLGNLDGPRDS